MTLDKFLIESNCKVNAIKLTIILLQKPSEVEVVAEAEAGAGFKIENEEDVFPSLHVIEEEIIAGLIADLEKNDPEHAEYCKDLQKLLENDEKADEILAYATEIMDRPLEDYGFSDLVI